MMTDRVIRTEQELLDMAASLPPFDPEQYHRDMMFQFAVMLAQSTEYVWIKRVEE